MFRDLRLTIARELHRFPHEVGRMPFADAVDLVKHFGRYPPVHVSMAIQIHWTPKDQSTEMTDDDFRRMRGPIGG